MNRAALKKRHEAEHVSASLDGTHISFEAGGAIRQVMITSVWRQSLCSTAQG